MTNPTGPGWYDDPEAPDQLRYFDGVVWTRHTVARGPSAESGSGAAVGPPGSQTADQSAGAVSPTPTGPAAAVPGPSVADRPTAPSTGVSGSPGHPGQFPAPPEVGSSAQGRPSSGRGPVTEDGVRLASYPQRVGAWLIDGVIKFVINLVLGGWAAYLAVKPALDDAADATRAGRTASLSMAQTAQTQWFAVYLVITAVVGLGYSTFFLSRTGATPGKRLLGISVRLAQRPGPIAVETCALRYAIPFATGVLTVVPWLGSALFLLWCSDHAFPLVTPKRQALHDMLAKTVVVIGGQPPRA